MHYKIIKLPQEVYKSLGVERRIYNYDSFKFGANLLKADFRKSFDSYLFLPLNGFFGDECTYKKLSLFLELVDEEWFTLSAPLFNLRFPVKFHRNCPFDLFSNACRYTISETKFHEWEGVGFFAILEVFMYGQSESWAMVHDDVNDIIIVALSKKVAPFFEEAFQGYYMNSEEAVRHIERHFSGDFINPQYFFDLYPMQPSL